MTGPPPASTGPEAAIAGLAAALAAARRIELDATDAEAVLARARQRAGFAGSAYVLALAGGTGVGKSSVLNALAGRTVSAVRAVRPTTDEPVGWVAEGLLVELAPLFEWLGVRHVVGHADPQLRHVAIIDLPDVDSQRTAHRTRVDELLPRLDRIAWVVDPEKYDDERIHEYLRAERDPRRLIFILNKTDRLRTADVSALREDLERRLRGAGIADPQIVAISAKQGSGEIDRLRALIGEEADAKAVIARRLVADAVAAARSLAARAGIDPDGSPEPLLSVRRRDAAIIETVAGALALVDLPGVRRQATNAVLQRSRRTAGGLLGRGMALLQLIGGRSAGAADPAGYLRSWRRRGTLARAVNPVRAAVADAAAAAPLAWRPHLLSVAGAGHVEASLTSAIDGAVAESALDARPPGSWLWWPIGALQLVASAALIFAIAWYVTLFLAQGVPVTTVELPILGPIPLPLALLTAAIVVSAILAFVLRLHAGWVARRWASVIADRVEMAVSEAIERKALAPLDALDRERGVLTEAIGRVLAAAEEEPPLATSGGVGP
ncbi:MAG: GTPase domain-containing protein [Chloroflexota bacterium]